MDDFTNILSIYSKTYKEIKEKITGRKKLKRNLQEQKVILCEKWSDLKNIDLETPLYDKFTKEELSYFLKTAEKLKNENPEIYRFACKLLKHVEPENMRNFMKNALFINIHPHPLKEAKKASNGNYILGTYKFEDKTIDIYYHDDKSILYHELLHAASSEFSYKVCGFNTLLENGYRFGIGLNEGYTEILNKRFFNFHGNTYIRLQELAELIEMFYENKEDMVTDYFNADVFGLIGELLKSMTLEEAIDIIVDIDGFLYDEQTETDYLNLKQKIINLLQKSPIVQDENLNLSSKEKVLSRTY